MRKSPIWVVAFCECEAPPPAFATQAGGAPEEGVVAGGDDHRAHLALLGDTAGVTLVTELLAHRQGLAGQRRLVDADVIPVDEAHVGGHDLAELDAHHVAGNHLGGVDGGELSIAQGRRLWRHARLQRRQRVGGLALLPEAGDGVVEQQHQNDGEIGPMAHQQGQQRRRLDHPGDRAPEEAQELLQITDFLCNRLPPPPKFTEDA